jgi:hypothetical protein
MGYFRHSSVLLFAVAFLLPGPPPVAAQDTTGVGTIAGTVVSAALQPVANVAVCVQATDRCSVTDADGAFSIPDLRASKYVVEITAPGQPPIVSEPIEVRPGLEARVEVTLPELSDLQKTLEVTVTAPAFVAPEEVKNSSYLIRGRDIDTGAGALQDVSRYVQSLPGVAIGTNDFRNDIIVRGGSPLENLFVVDNVEVPNINTFANFASAGGTVSILDATLIQDVTFLTGGYPAPYINRASSVLQISQREGSRQEFGGAVTLGFAGTGAVLEGPIDGGRGSWVMSARRTFLDLFTDDIGVGGVPVTYAFNGKVVYDLSQRDRIWFVNVSANDTIRLGATTTDISEDPDSQLNNFDIRYSGWRTATGFNWQRLFGSRGVGLLGVTYSKAKVEQTTKDLIRDGIPPPDQPIDEVIEDAPITFAEDSAESETTVKYDLTTYLGRIGKIQVGGSVKLFGIDYDAVAPYGNDSPYAPVPGLNPFALQQSYTSTQTGIYVQATTDVTKAFNVTWGGRIDNYAYISQTRVSPRLGAGYAVTDRLSLNGSYGLYYQQPAFLFLSTFPENRGLVPFRAEHFVGGATYRMGESTKFSVEAYRKNYKDYPVATQFETVSLANVGDTFVVQDLLFPDDECRSRAGDGRRGGGRADVLREVVRAGQLRVFEDPPRGARRRRETRIVRLPGNRQRGGRISLQPALADLVSPELPFGAPLHALRCGVVDRAVPRRVRPDASQRTAPARLLPPRHPGGLHADGGRAAAHAVWRGAERHQPPQHRGLHLEPPHRRGHRAGAAGALPDHRG